MEGGEEREPSQETLGTECPKFIVTAKSVLLADMTPPGLTPSTGPTHS